MTKSGGSGAGFLESGGGGVTSGFKGGVEWTVVMGGGTAVRGGSGGC